jgi:hypothetical protein
MTSAVAAISVVLLLIIGLLWQQSRNRKAEVVILESEKRSKVMAETTPALIWMCDAQGEVTYLNDRGLSSPARIRMPGMTPRGLDTSTQMIKRMFWMQSPRP